MDKIEITRIENYLKKKELSDQLFYEILEHFILQIESKMNKKMSFEEAFLEVKLAWQYDLEMVRPVFFAFKRVARIEKNTLHKRLYTIVGFSFLCTAIVSITALFLNIDFINLLFYIVGLQILLLFYCFVRKRMRFRNYIELSFHPILLIGLFGWILGYSINTYFIKNEYWFDFYKNGLQLYMALSNVGLLYYLSKKEKILL